MDRMYCLALTFTFMLGAADVSRTKSRNTGYPARCKHDSYGLLLRIDCVDLGLKDIPSNLSVFTSYLDLSMNSLRLLPVAGFTHLRFLQELRLSGNGLTEIPKGAFTGLLNLKILMLQNNNLKQVPTKALENLRKLQSLHLDANHIASVPAGSFKGLASLRHLWLDDNALTDVPTHAFARVPGLQAVTLALNHITHIPDRAFASLTHLVVLHLQNNRIHSLGERCFDGLDNLETLDLNYNNIDMFPTAIGALPNLKELTFHSNRIQSIPEYAFTRNPSLVTIYFHNNPLQFVDWSAFQHLPELHTLSLNRASEMTEFPDFTGTHSLESLAVTGAPISSLPSTLCDQLPNLTRLDLSHNLIQRLPSFSGCRKILDIDLSSNRLSSLSLDGLQGLTHLRLAGNMELRDTSPLLNLPRLRVVEMPYASQCCVFVRREKNNSGRVWKRGSSENTKDDDPMEFEARSQHRVQCSPPPGPFQPCQSLFQSRLERGGVWTVVIFSFTGNSLVLLSIFFSSAPATPNQHLLGALAWVHLLAGLSSAVLAVVDGMTMGDFAAYGPWWEKGPGCRLVNFLSTFSSEACVFLLTAIVIERGYSARCTNGRRTRKNLLRFGSVQVILVLCCTLSVVIAAWCLLNESGNDLSSLCVDFPHRLSTHLGYAAALVLINSLCYMLMTVIYIRLYCHMEKEMSETDGSKDCATTKMVACFLLTNSLLSFPSAVLFFSSLLRLPLLSSPEVARFVMLLIVPLPTCLNPLLYMLLNPHLRGELNKRLHWMSYRLKGEHRASSRLGLSSEAVL